MCCPHPERPNVLSLPSMGNPHSCAECWDAANAGMTAYKGKREAWDHNGADHYANGESMFTRGTGGYFVETYHDPKERTWK